MSEQGLLPEQSEAQRIGALAQKCFRANIPDEWIPTDLAGDEDFGYDYQIQVMEAGCATHIFRAQLKGTTCPELSATKDFFSIQLKASTVRYYMKCNEPILLVLADLSSDDKPKNCPLYFVWIHEELRRLNAEELADDQKYITFRVPAVNNLTDETNLSDELERCRRLGMVGNAMDVLADRLNPGMAPTARVNLLERIPVNLAQSSPLLLSAIAEEPKSAWPQAPRGSFPWHLNEAAEQLRQGNAPEASEHLYAAEALMENTSTLERSEHMYLMGLLHAFRLNDKLAVEAYAAAAELYENSPKYLVAWAEANLRLRYSEDHVQDFSDVIARISGSDSLSSGIRARLLAASGRYEDALKTAEQTSGSEGWAARSIIHSMLSEWRLALEACTAGLAEPHLRDRAKQLFFVIRARARFNLAIGRFSSAEPGTIIPPTGPIDTNLSLLREAWQDILVAVSSLRSSGWTSNTELIADIWGATALILGKQHDALPLLTEAAASRPNMSVLQVALETLATHISNFSLALEANARQPETDAQILRCVTLLHMAGKHGECVSLFQLKGQMASTSDPLFGFAITQAILSAERIVRTDLSLEWESIFASDPKIKPYQDLLKFWRAKNNNLLARDKALEQLELAYETLGKPLMLGIHLFMELDAVDKAQAAKIALMVKDLTADRMLPPDAAIHLSHALATIDDWEGVLQLSRDALARYDSHEHFAAIEAFALDRLGLSTDALSLLRKLLAKGSTDRFALNTYVNIAVRCGFIEDAVRSVESIVAVEMDQSKRIDALQLLFNLIHHSDPQNPRVLEIALRIGELVKQDNQEQEGLFLVLMLAAILHTTVEATDPRLVDFHSRTQAFMRRFPSSNILRTVHVPENACPNELMQVLREISGIDEEQLRWSENLERQLQRGEIPIPYSWRPRRILRNVPDVPTLWAIGKNSKPHERKFHLSMALDDWKPVSTTQLTKAVPLLDLITLLVVSDLGILDLIFRLFPKIAIGQATLTELIQLLSPMSGSPMRQDCLVLQDVLKNHLNQVIQPWVDTPDEHYTRANHWPMEEVKELVSVGSYALYSDDAIFRVYCEIPEITHPSFCTLDVLKALEGKDMLSTREVAEKISKLCAWHVGLRIELKYQVAILPAELGQARSVSKGIDILRASVPCIAVFDEIWDIRKPFEDLILHAATIFIEFTSLNVNRDESIAAVMGLWFGKAKLHKDAPFPSEQLLAELLLLSAKLNTQLFAVEMIRKLWSVYRLLIALQYGDRMDEAKEKAAIALAGEMAAQLDHKNNFLGEQSLRSRLVLGLTPGTSDADEFNLGYNRYSSVLVAAAKSR